MLTTLIRLMGAWMAVYGLMFGTHFTYMLEYKPSSMETFLAFLPSLVSFAMGIGYVIFAPKLAGGKDSTAESIPDILPAGLILLGLYWVNSGIFQALGNFNFYKQIFDERYGIFSDNAKWVAIGNLVQVIVGTIVFITGFRMREEHKAQKDAS